MFHFFFLPTNNYFEPLRSSVVWETVGKGRAMATLINSDNADALIPVVRSTTVCHHPTQWFGDIHHTVLRDLLCAMPDHVVEPPKFNNAMLELYTPECRAMKYHSDLALDLHPDSYIAIFSCYDTTYAAKRKLVIKNKTTGTIREIVLEHNMVVLFSLDTNRQHLHKIVPATGNPSSPAPGPGQWMGMTFRTSRTFVAHDPMLGCALRLATPEEHSHFLRLRSQENKSTDFFDYGHVDYTISPGDLLVPTHA